MTTSPPKMATKFFQELEANLPKHPQEDELAEYIEGNFEELLRKAIPIIREVESQGNGKRTTSDKGLESSTLRGEKDKAPHS